MKGSNTSKRKLAIVAGAAVATLIAAFVPLKPAAADGWGHHHGWYGGNSWGFSIYGAPGYYYVPPPPVYYAPPPPTYYYAPPPPVYYEPPPAYYAPPTLGIGLNFRVH